MPRAIREFRPIAPVDFRGAMAGTQQAGTQFNAGFDALNRVVQNVQAANDAQAARATAQNNAAIQANLERLQSIGDLVEAEEAGAFGVETLQQQFGTRYDAGKATEMLNARRTKLKEEGTQDFLAAHQDKVSSHADIEGLMALPGAENLDQAALRNTLSQRLQGTRADTQQSRADAAYFKKQTQEADDLAATKALMGYSAAVAKGTPLAEAEAQFSTDLSPRAAEKFLAGKTQAVNKRQALTDEQNRAYSRRQEEWTAEGNMLTMQAQQAMAPEQTKLAQLTQVVDGDKTAATRIFGSLKGMENFDSVLDAMSREDSLITLEKTKPLSELHQRLSKVYGSEDASRLIAQGYSAVKANNDHWYGQSINVPAIEAQVNAMAEREAAMKTQLTKVSGLKAAEQERQLRYSTRMQTDLDQMHKTQVKGNQPTARRKTAKAPTQKKKSAVQALAERAGVDTKTPAPKPPSEKPAPKSSPIKRLSQEKLNKNLTKMRLKQKQQEEDEQARTRKILIQRARNRQ